MKVKFVYIDIPSIADTSVVSSLRELFGNIRVAHFNGWQRVAYFRSLTREELSGYRCIGGHINYEAFLQKVGPRPLYFSILRDPIDRYLSYYSQVCHQQSHHLHNNAKAISSVEFFRDSISRKYIFPQTLYISRNNSLVSALKLIREGKIIVQPLENYDKLLQFIALKAGKEPIILPRKNKFKRDLPADFDELEPLIREFFKDDFTLFDYVNSAEF